MKTLMLAALFALSSGGDRERGLELYRQGRFQEAAAAFRAALASEGDSADLQYNLALASWRAGDLAGAESAVEKYAAGAADARPELHAGLLGAVRYDEAKALEATADQAAAAGGAGAPPAAAGAPAPSAPADPLPLLEQALAKAQQAKDHFVRGATRSASPELLRNTERAVGLCDELQKKIEELKRQREQQKQDDQKDDQKDQRDQKDQKQDQKQQEEKQQDPKQDEKQQNDQNQQGDQKQSGESQERPEPKTEDPEAKPQQAPESQESKSDGKQGDEKPEPKPATGKADEQPKDGAEPAEPRHDAPGEVAEARELSPEQTQRLLEQLKELDGKMKALRAFGTTRRRSVERDW